MTPNHRRQRKNRVCFVQIVREALPKRFFVKFCRFMRFSQNPQTSFRTAHGGKNRGSALRAASPVACALQPRKTTENHRKIEPEPSGKPRSFRNFRYFWSGIPGFSGISDPEYPDFLEFLDFPGGTLRERPSKANSSPCAYFQGAKHVRALVELRSARP